MADPAKGCGLAIILATAVFTILYIAVWWVFGVEWAIFIFLVVCLVIGLLSLVIEFLTPKIDR